VIQNLANNILFGKEAFMTQLNAFLTNNIMPVTRFLSDVLVGLMLFLISKLLTEPSRNIRPHLEIPIKLNGLAYSTMKQIICYFIASFP
jgi:hypothetical protein